MSANADIYIKAVTKELKSSAESFAGRQAASIYFGGGTPSLLSPENIGRIIKTCRENYDISSRAEITMEMNPESVSEQKTAACLNAGINRISLGIQSLDDDILTFLGRIHDADKAVAAFKALRNAGCKNISCDLIYAIPGQDENRFLKCLDRLVKLDPESVSCYELTFEKGTKLYDDAKSGRIKTRDEEDAELFKLIEDHLSQAGYDHYEISNYAKKGFKSVHNLGYWHCHDYLGVGPSAATLCNGVRHKNIADTSAYADAILSGHSAVAEKETLSGTTKKFEQLMLGLRLKDGILFEPKDIDEPIQKAVDEKILIYNAGMLRATKQSWPVLDNLLLRL